jgi:hypothetical protein
MAATLLPHSPTHLARIAAATATAAAAATPLSP